VTALVPASAGATAPDGDWEQGPSPAGTTGWGIGGSEEAIVVSTLDDGNFRSVDGGQTWEPIDAEPEEGDAAFDETNPKLGYLAGFGGLARTTDAGATWETIVESDRVAALDAGADGAVVATVRTEGFNVEVWRSTDGGDTWTDLGWPGDTALLNEIEFGANPDEIAVIDGTGTWYTTDGGDTWRSEDDGGRWMTSEADGTLWRAGYGPLERSTDFGQSWDTVDEPANVRELGNRPAGGVYVATNGGVYTTPDDGSTWTFMGAEAIGWIATGLLADPANPDAVLVTDEGVGVTWLGPDGDGGYMQEGQTTGFPPVHVDGLDYGTNGEAGVAGTRQGVYTTTDGGATWSHTGAGIGLDTLNAAGTTDGSTYYVGGQNLLFQPILIHSDDGGQTWNYTVPEGNDGIVKGIETHPTDPDTAWAATWIELSESSVYQTIDGGDTWRPLVTLPTKIHDVAYQPALDELLVATNTGVIAVEPTTGAITPRSVATSSTAVATGGDAAYAEGSGASLWRSPTAGVPFAPWSDTDGDIRDLAAHPTGTSAFGVLDDGSAVACPSEATGPLTTPSTCTDHTPDATAFTDLAVEPSGDGLVGATEGEGLLRLELTDG